MSSQDPVSRPVSALLGADFDDYLSDAMMGEPLPHLIPGERIDCLPTKRFAWLPCRLSDYSWTWLRPIWAWPVTQKWMLHPLAVTLYTIRTDGPKGQDGQLRDEPPSIPTGTDEGAGR